MTIEILEKRREHNLFGVKISANLNHPLVREKILEDNRRYSHFGFNPIKNPSVSYLFTDNLDVIDLIFSARIGNFKSMIKLYNLYIDGRYVPYDGYQAIHWFRHIENCKIRHFYYEDELSEIYCSIGLIYFLGDGLPKNLGKAIWWFKRAVEYGNAEAMYILGEIYLHAKNKPDDVWFVRDDEIFKDLNVAFYWFNRCFESCSDKLRGKLYLYGIGIENNEEAAFELFTESVQCLNYSQKMYKLGMKYIYGTKKDFDKGIYWLKRAADHLNDDAILELGKVYLHGTIEAVDVNQAAWWFEKITDFNRLNNKLIDELIYKYRYGENVDKNIDTVIYWYKKLANIGNVQALHELSKIYRYGEGVEKNLSEAIKWLDMAFRTNLSSGR